MAGTRWLTADEQRAWRAYLEATHALLAAIDGQLQQSMGVPHAYYEILVRLSEAPDRSLRMSQLAEACMSSKSRLSHAVARLEERGWVERLNCPSDRRGQFARLTPAGFAALEAGAHGHVEQVRNALFDPLSPEQVDQLAAISRTIAAAADGAMGEGGLDSCCSNDAEEA